MRPAVATLGLAAALGLGPAAAEAAVVDGDQPAIVLTLGLGTLAGITTSIAAIVYAVKGKSFHTPWVVVSMFSCAITGSFAATLAVDTAREGFGAIRAIGLLSFAGLTAGPLYFTIRSALSPGPPGAYFDELPEAAWRRPALDPFARREVTVDPGAVLLPAFATRF